MFLYYFLLINQQIKARVELENQIIIYKNDLNFKGIKKEKLN